MLQPQILTSDPFPVCVYIVLLTFQESYCSVLSADFQMFFFYV